MPNHYCQRDGKRGSLPHFDHHVLKELRRVPAVDADVELTWRDYVLHKDPHQGASVQWRKSAEFLCTHGIWWDVMVCD